VANPALTDIAKLQALRDPLLSFKWVAESLPTISGIHLEPSFLESIDLPFNNISIADSWHGGSGFTYYPGTHDISSFSCTFYEDNHATTTKWLIAWKALVKDMDTGFYNLPSVFKKNINVIMLDSKNNSVLKAEMTGLWPAETGNFALNYSDSGRIIITQTFSCDGQVLTPLM